MRGNRAAHTGVDPSVFSTERGIRAIKWSFWTLLATACLQALVVWLSGSIALFADATHNVADAFTAIPLWVAFRLARAPPTRRFPYGYGRLEDLAGLLIVLTIVASAVAAGYESLVRLVHPQKVEYLWVVSAASVLGFIGNEAVALVRIAVGREIGSAALVADGYHARLDGLTSLAVLVSAAGVWSGYPLADPLVGLVITAVIFSIVWESGRFVFTRLLDGVAPEVIDEIRDAAAHAPGVGEVTEVRVRWVGHRLHAELNIAVGAELSVAAGHEIAKEVRHRLLHHVGYLSDVTIHVDPAGASGNQYHRIDEHKHDDFAAHSHS